MFCIDVLLIRKSTFSWVDSVGVGVVTKLEIDSRLKDWGGVGVTTGGGGIAGYAGGTFQARSVFSATIGGVSLRDEGTETSMSLSDAKNSGCSIFSVSIYSSYAQY